MQTISTHTNQNGETYYSTTGGNGERIYSFSADFDDYWTQDDQDLHCPSAFEIG